MPSLPIISDNTRNWAVLVGAIVSAGSLFFVARSYLRNAEIESEKWQAHLSVELAALDSNGSTSAAPPTAPAHPTPRAMETLHLLVRDASFRPAAIVKVALRDASGAEFSAREIARRLRLPLALDPWRIVALEFEMDAGDFRRAAKLVVRDMDDREIAIPLQDPAAYEKWFDFR
ncbi:MAG TPA: hypothetical protein VMK42_10630 [Anaeromyxobacteraceae bacterium]|nr:hypothetical protein [Anaeromyxobacteraceae bacterium]